MNFHKNNLNLNEILPQLEQVEDMQLEGDE